MPIFYSRTVDEFLCRMADELTGRRNAERAVTFSGERCEEAAAVLRLGGVRNACLALARVAGASAVVVLDSEESRQLDCAAFVGEAAWIVGTCAVTPYVELTDSTDVATNFDLIGRFVVIAAAPKVLARALRFAVPEASLDDLIHPRPGDVPVVTGVGAKATVVMVSVDEG